MTLAAASDVAGTSNKRRRPTGLLLVAIPVFSRDARLTAVAAWYF